MTGEAIEVVRHPTARTIRLSVCPASGRVRLTLPRRAGMKQALAWAEGKRDWLDAQRARVASAVPFAEGTVLTVADRAVTIVREEGRRRALVLDGDRLLVAGPEETVARRVEAWLKAAALDLLAKETAEFAAKAGVSVASVKVGDPRGRWGSCASSGTIRYSWRLILAPGWVRRATVAHEVAHRVHMNHAPAFHALVDALLGEDATPARDWLRAHGAGLHRVGGRAERLPLLSPLPLAGEGWVRVAFLLLRGEEESPPSPIATRVETHNHQVTMAARLMVAA